MRLRPLKQIKELIRRSPRAAIAVSAILLVTGIVVLLTIVEPESTQQQVIVASAADKEALFADRDELLNSITFKPVQEEGQIVGLAISRLKSGSLFEDIGLEKGDLLKKVNHLRFDSLEDALRLKDELADASELDVQLSRAGKTKNFRVEFK